MQMDIELNMIAMSLENSSKMEVFMAIKHLFTTQMAFIGIKLEFKNQILKRRVFTQTAMSNIFLNFNC